MRRIALYGRLPFAAALHTSRSYAHDPASTKRREGDWDCPNCAKLNFNRRSSCFSCNLPKPAEMTSFFMTPQNESQSEGVEVSRPFTDRKQAAVKRGDWVCRKCSAHNFAFRNNCLDCGTKRPAFDTTESQMPFTGEPKRSSPQTTRELSDREDVLFGELTAPGLPPPKSGDWRCAGCQFVNFATRESCKTCGNEKGDNKNLVFTEEDIAELLLRRKLSLKSRYDEHPSDEPRRSSRSTNDRPMRSNGPILPGDWGCPKCGYNNFASRTHCNQCKAMKGSTPTSASSNEETLEEPMNAIHSKTDGLESMLSEVLGSDFK